MIFLTTGLPGSGKTLSTLVEVKKLAEKEKREVYYAGIAGLTLPWHKLDDATKWHQVPQGSIIVIDECQQILPTRKAGDKAPDYIEAFSTHRHKGHDVFLITQDPMQFDHFVRRLVGVHWHCVRPFGLSYATVWQFEGVKKPDDWHEQQKATKRRFDYPKEAFGWYKSAEVHTHKRRLPWRRLSLVFAAFALLGISIWGSLHVLGKMGTKEEPEVVAAKSEKGAAGGGFVGGLSIGGKGSERDEGLRYADPEFRKADADAWLHVRMPRFERLPESAPIYDELTKPVSFPRLAGCVFSSKLSRCSCFTQQGTPYGAVDARACLHFVAWGSFDHYRPDAKAPEGLTTGAPKDSVPAPQGPSTQGGGGAVAATLREPLTVPQTVSQQRDATRWEPAGTGPSGPPGPDAKGVGAI